jgi:type II secretory pathway pseudopilin PulG
MKRLKLEKPTLIALIVIAMLLIVIAILGWKYMATTKTSAADEQQQTISRVLQGVGTIYELPTDEEPTVAQIQDKTKLENQEFFKKSRNGDYLLLYKKNRLALVYREATKKLVIVGPINLDANNSDPSASGNVSGDATSSPSTTKP